jgi:glyoxylase-like metal-dependent hydrolase (beta-lactamase superfamily II)
MGDGSLVLLPTPGHTAGSMSLLVRRTRKPTLLLTGDLAYHADLMPRGQLPGVGRRRQLAESTRSVLALAGKYPGLVMLPAHDPAAARRLLAN